MEIRVDSVLGGEQLPVHVRGESPQSYPPNHPGK